MNYAAIHYLYPYLPDEGAIEVFDSFDAARDDIVFRLDLHCDQDLTGFEPEFEDLSYEDLEEDYVSTIKYVQRSSKPFEIALSNGYTYGVYETDEEITDGY